MRSKERQAQWSLVATAAALITAFFPLVSADAADTAADREQQLLEQIQDTLARSGPFATDLLEPLTGLGLLYQESGEHHLALAAIERARQVVRVNRGLHTLDQVPLVLQQIHSQQARGNDTAVWELEQDLLTLIRRHPDDIRTVPMLRAMADRQMATLHEYIDGEQPPEVVYGCFYQQWPTADGGSCTAGSRKVVIRGMLAEAQRTYADAINVLVRHGLYGSDELRDLEQELLAGVDLLRTLYGGPGEHPVLMLPGFRGSESMEPWRSRVAPVMELARLDLEQLRHGEREQGGTRSVEATHWRLTDPYYRGRQGLGRLYAYEAANASSPRVQADAMAQIADWDLLYSHNGLAIEGYEMARTLLQETDQPAPLLDELFAPATPVVLPAFRPNPLAPNDVRAATGHIDVAFTLTKYGRGRDVEVRDAANATVGAQDRLVGLIMRSRFRPQLTEGEFAAETPVAFRYYLYENDYRR